MNEKRYSLATEYFNVASNKYGSGRDKFRNRLCMLLAYVAAGERARAEVGMRALLQEAAGSPYLPAIRKVADLVSPPAKEKTSSPEAKKSPQ